MWCIISPTCRSFRSAPDHYEPIPPQENSGGTKAKAGQSKYYAKIVCSHFVVYPIWKLQLRRYRYFDKKKNYMNTKTILTILNILKLEFTWTSLILIKIEKPLVTNFCFLLSKVYMFIWSVFHAFQDVFAHSFLCFVNSSILKLFNFN